MSLMKKLLTLVFLILLIPAQTACAKTAAVRQGIITDLSSYLELDDGTWKCGDTIYKYRLEITGRMPNAMKDSTFVYLSNLPEISFEQAYKAAGISSDLNDYFRSEDAVLVEWIVPD